MLRDAQQKYSDPLDQALDKWNDAISHWQKCALMHVNLETNFKSWEAMIKHSYMLAKTSATMAETKVRCHDEWQDRFLKVNESMIKAETAKRIMRVAEARWETERTKAVNLRGVR